jgi:LytS/YehU family sensor histidine kinase
LSDNRSIWPMLIIFIVIAVALLIIIILLFNKLRFIRRENSLLKRSYQELEKKTAVADDEVLRYKLNPHLFKNALNAIQSHAYQSYYALDKLSNVLDYILYESSTQYVNLKEEIEFTKSLIEINRLKTSPLFNLHVKNKINVEDRLYASGLIAPLITINPIENAFKHANLQREDAFISIVFDLVDEWFQLSVSNSVEEGNNMEKIKGGLGNPTFNKRLKAIYGQDFNYHESVGNGIYTTYLEIKLRESYG